LCDAARNRGARLGKRAIAERMDGSQAGRGTNATLPEQLIHVFIDRKRWRQRISRHLQPLREITLRHSGGVELL
jgi:hypothetical protein